VIHFQTISLLLLCPNFDLHSDDGEKYIYLVFSMLISRPTFLLTSFKFSVCLFIVICYLPVHHIISIHQKLMCPIQLQSHWFSYIFIMAYSKVKLKSIGEKASPCSRPLWIGKLSEKCLLIQILLCVSFQHILFSQTNFMGTILPSSLNHRLS
jgi:hypothetical protein